MIPTRFTECTIGDSSICTFLNDKVIHVITSDNTLLSILVRIFSSTLVYLSYPVVFQIDR